MNPETANEADILEQRTALAPDEPAEETPDAGEVAEADPADVQEQRTEVADGEERRDD